jgi:hypothetical protein
MLGASPAMSSVRFVAAASLVACHGGGDGQIAARLAPMSMD